MGIHSLPTPFTTEERSLINELRFDDIGIEQKTAILEKTFQSRRKWVMQCHPSYADYFTKFPPLKDMGIHFCKEFGRCCPEAKDFLVQWEDIAPLVVNWAANKLNATAQLILSELNSNAGPSIEREMQYALYLLPYILQVPPRKLKRPSNDEAAYHFIRFYPESSSIQEILDKAVAEGNNHPQVVVCGSRDEVGQVFLTVEGQAMLVQHGVVAAVDRLIKLYFILDMEYADESRHILHFLQRQVLGVHDQFTLSRSGSDLSLFICNKRPKF